MGLKFDQWLAKPTTIHLLRQLVFPQACSASARHAPRVFRRLRHKSCDGAPGRAVALQRVEDKDGDMRGGHAGIGGPIDRTWNLRRVAPEDEDSAEIALHMSMRTGVPMLNEDLRSRTFIELEHQADVNTDWKMGKLLVDQPDNRDNAVLWLELLQFRQRLHGLSGAIEVWTGMRKRRFDLPSSGPLGKRLWTILLRATALRTTEEQDDNTQAEGLRLTQELLDHAIDVKGRTGQYFESIYKCVVGAFLRKSSRKAQIQAVEFDRMLTSAGLRPSTGLAGIVDNVLLSARRDRALHTFQLLYKGSEQRDMYDSAVSQALEMNDEAAALFLHQLFLQAGDRPSPLLAETPAIQRLFDLDKHKKLPIDVQQSWRSQLKISSPNIPKAHPLELTRTGMNAYLGIAHGIKQKEISDHFCARLFATRAFSIDLVIKTLTLFGVESIGPLALRQMAIRADSAQDICEKLNDLKRNGIQLGEHIYSQLLYKAAHEGQTSLVDALLHSDQHPESYEDLATQEALLASFIKARNWTQAHASFLALTLMGSQGLAHASNLILQHYAKGKEYRSMLSTYESMRNQGIALSQTALRYIYWKVLPKRERGKRPIKGAGPDFFDPLDFVTNVHQRASEQGAYIQTGDWKELLKRYGMDNRWDDVERLVQWLVQHYSPEHSAKLLGLSGEICVHEDRVQLRVDTLRTIFTANLQKALFAWAFRSASVHRQLKPALQVKTPSPTEITREGTPSPETWARGLALLKSLGSLVDIDNVRNAFENRMWIMFGPGYSTRRLNDEARRENRLSLVHYIRHANEIWPGLVHWIDPNLLGPSKLLDSY